MIIDSKLLPVLERANRGDTKAQFEMALAFLQGKGVPQDWSKTQYYYLQLAQNDPVDIDFVPYGTLLTFIADIYFDFQNFNDAACWYQKAISYIRETYVEEFANQLIGELEIEKSLKAIGHH